MPRWTLILLAAVLSAQLFCSETRAQHGSPSRPSPVGPHGGDLVESNGRIFEVAFKDNRVRVFMFDPTGKPANVSGARGTLLLRAAGTSRSYRYDIYPEGTTASESNCLIAEGAFEFIGNIPAVAIVSIKVSSGEVARFRMRPKLALSRTQLEINAQHCCPVSLMRLGSMGLPTRSKVNGKAVYLCCKGCEQPLLKDPERYLARLPKPLMMQASETDRLAIKLQGLCPVERTQLPSGSKAWKIQLRGRVFFVCSKNCAKSVQRLPERYLHRDDIARGQHDGNPAANSRE